MNIVGTYRLALMESFLFLPPYLERCLDVDDLLCVIPSLKAFAGESQPYLIAGTEAVLDAHYPGKCRPLTYRGRYLALPPAERDFLGVEKSVALVGMGNSFELWKPQTLACYEQLQEQRVWPELENLSLR